MDGGEVRDTGEKMKLVTVTQMKVIEQEADATGLSYDMMMENAGSGVADVILEMGFAEEEEPQALALVGPGNNGGDALVALAHLAAQEWAVRAYLINRKIKNDPLVERLRQAGGEIVLASDDEIYDKLSAFVETSHVLIDGVLGTGFRLPLKADVAAVLAAANEAISETDDPPYVVAVDCPSGVDCDSGEAAPEAIAASVTVCMAAVKQGLLKFPAFDLVGELHVADIGLAGDLPSWAEIRHTVPDSEMVGSSLPSRPDDAHKGTFGTALVVAGSLNFTGAALLAGKAAYRAGAGVVDENNLIRQAIAFHDTVDPLPKLRNRLRLILGRNDYRYVRGSCQIAGCGLFFCVKMVRITPQSISKNMPTRNPSPAIISGVMNLEVMFIA